MSFLELIGRACCDPSFRSDLAKRGAMATGAGAGSLSSGQKAFFDAFKNNLELRQVTEKMDALIRVHCPAAPKC